MVETHLTEEEYWEEIARLARRPAREPGEFTRQEYADRFGVTRDVARTELEKAVRRGELIRREVVDKGRPVIVYKVVVND